MPSVDVLKVPGLIPEALYEITVRPQEHNIKMFGALINIVSPIPLNEEGMVVNFVNKRYSIEQLMKMKSNEKYQAYGDAIINGAIKLLPQWAGNGFSEKVRLLGDFGSQLYYIKKI
jgi:alpha-galactosidase